MHACDLILRPAVPLAESGGGSRVYSGEEEVSVAFIEGALDSLAATPERIDRARAHSELTSV